ncbi:FAD-dependent oxidoreductase [Selenomonas ruminantium]|uniref:Tat (Twin-arginine translocation) pathway signal sequence n=1 Tax=Selenomonas ruminantium TaxID=971 RepID=A0A1I0Y875_SELRU|nr:FAD-dependent oxidoreductase [Selenomonas ruminantium]SFB08680.1 Tat (twin-arginine translocation) pathway signal sequence [Selenomonas ruminantium]
MEQSFSIPISRRDFMKLAGLSAAGALLGGALPQGKAEAATGRFDFAGADLPVLCEVDVCVAGGGSAGTAAAINAAKNGAKTVLVEQGISLGGLATQGCVFPCMPTFAYDSDTPYITELNQRMEKQGSPVMMGFEDENFYGGGAGQYMPEWLTWACDEWCEETGVTILYGTSLVGAVVEDGAITACVVQTAEGLGKIKAKTFIDATGDALLARFAGVPTEKGSEKSGRNQPMSLRFEMSGIDVPKVFHFFHDKLKDTWMGKKGAEKFLQDVKKGRNPFMEFAKWKKTEDFFKSGLKTGELTEDDLLYIQAFTLRGKPHTMSMNCPEMPPMVFSSTDAMSRSQAVTFGRKMSRRLALFFQKHIPGFEKAYISREASMVGVRESWRIRGKYYLEADDYLKARKFPDAVCRTAYPIDIHDVQLDLYKKLAKGEYYEIPFRALVADKVTNLLVAGRCASGSFAAQASFRIQPTCMSMGEAAGIAAAWGLKHNIPVSSLKWEDIPESQRSYVSKP